MTNNVTYNQPDNNQGVIPAATTIKTTLDSGAHVQHVNLDNNGMVDSGNSSTDILAAGAAFTGSWTDVSGIPSFTVAVATDQDGNYSVQYSPDGSSDTVDSTLTRYYRTARINPPHRFSNTRNYARVVFTNSSSDAQTYFRLQTMLNDIQPLNIPTDAVVAQDYDAVVVRPTDVQHEIALGLRQGITLWNKFGYNLDVDLAASETIWAAGGNVSPVTTASTLTVVSSSSDDVSGGSGARTITVYGLDANRTAQTEVITMNGTTNVVTTTTWLGGMNRMVVTTAGSNGYNVGTITVTATTGGNVMGTIPAGIGITQQLLFYTQANHKSAADWLSLNANKIAVGNTPTVTITAIVWEFVSGAKYEIFRHVIDTAVDNTIEIAPPHPFIIPASSLLEFRASTTADNTVITGRFSLTEIRNLDA